VIHSVHISASQDRSFFYPRVQLFTLLATSDSGLWLQVNPTQRIEQDYFRKILTLVDFSPVPT